MPTVIVKYVEFGIMCCPDRIEVTRNGFAPMDFAKFVRLFDSAFCNAIFPGHIGTFFISIDTGGG
ncbi:hypothetical protein D3C85_1947560 [compost metagenome]